MKLCRPFGVSGLHRIAPYLHPHTRRSPQRGLARRALDGAASTGVNFPLLRIEGRYVIPVWCKLQEHSADCLTAYLADAGMLG